jgi:hypothetical protein
MQPKRRVPPQLAPNTWRPKLLLIRFTGKLLYAQDQSQFADARHMSYESTKAFFEQWRPKG